MRMEIQLPRRIEVTNYSDLEYLQRYMQKLNPRIRVEEITRVAGKFVGIVYEYGFLNAPEVKAMRAEILAEMKKKA